MDQDGTVNPIFYGRSLGQQFLEDQFAKSELSRLHYIECNEKEMHAEVYLGAKYTMKKSDGDGDLRNVGKKLILPSSFIGEIDICTKTTLIFVKMIAWTHSIEFQKRGFCHMHIVFWLGEGSHMSPKKLDQFICAELPEKYLKEKDHTGKLIVGG